MILIHAGHRLGIDNGGGYNGQTEAKTNINVAIRLAENLKRNGFQVKTTHDDPKLNKMDSVEILLWANKQKFQYCISIHQNDSKNESAEGSETLWNGKDIVAKELAESIQSELAKLGSKNRGVKSKADLAILKVKNCHCVLTEGAFMTKADIDRIDTLTEQHAQADAIYNGFLRHINKVGKL